MNKNLRGFSRQTAEFTAETHSRMYPQYRYSVLRDPDAEEDYGYIVRHNPESVFDKWERHGVWQAGVRLREEKLDAKFLAGGPDGDRKAQIWCVWQEFPTEDQMLIIGAGYTLDEARRNAEEPPLAENTP